MTRLMMRHLLCLAVIGLSLTPLTAYADAGTPTLVDAWLDWQQQRQAEGSPPLDWAYSFALRQQDVADIAERRTRLLGELDAMLPVAVASRDAALARTLKRWATRLRTLPARPARSPEPLGLLSLAGSLRRNPPMTEIRQLGTCRPPAWVEAWTRTGVQRLAWRSGLTLDGVLSELPIAATRRSDQAIVITPRGRTHRLGIAAWNQQDAPLPPGTRVILPLPEHTLEARLINRELAAFLASRLPGDDCTLWPN